MSANWYGRPEPTGAGPGAWKFRPRGTQVPVGGGKPQPEGMPPQPIRQPPQIQPPPRVPSPPQAGTMFNTPGAMPQVRPERAPLPPMASLYGAAPTMTATAPLPSAAKTSVATPTTGVEQAHNETGGEEGPQIPKKGQEFRDADGNKWQWDGTKWVNMGKGGGWGGTGGNGNGGRGVGGTQNPKPGAGGGAQDQDTGQDTTGGLLNDPPLPAPDPFSYLGMPENALQGLGAQYESAQGGLAGYYNDRMSSSGMGNAEKLALAYGTMNPLVSQANQARDAIVRARAATGNDAGIYAGLSQVSRDAGREQSNQARQNILTNEEIRRKEQAEGAAGNLNLYGQTQAETMEYLRMIANILGRQKGVKTAGSSSGADVGISWNPGGSNA